MRIAVLADTHDKLPASVTGAIGEADEIWHLGDICAPHLLAALQQIGPPVRFVRGNCDDEIAWPLTLDFALAGRRFHLEHIPSRHPPSGCDLFLHGHTHVPRDEVIAGVRFLNPGCITRPNRGAPASWAWLQFGADGSLTWELVRV